MNLPTPNEFAKDHGHSPFPPRWEKWLSAVRAGILSAQPVAGRHVSIDEHPGKGTVINVADTSARRPSGGVTPPFVCDGSVTVHVTSFTLSAAGTCSSGIVVTTTVPGSLTADLVFNTSTTPPVGDAIYCNGGGTNFSGATGGNLHFACGPDTLDFPNFCSTLLGRVTTAGTIYGTSFAVGDWVLLIGSLSYDVGGLGTCGACTGTAISGSVELVFPTVTNTITRSAGGVTSTFQLVFSF